MNQNRFLLPPLADGAEEELSRRIMVPARHRPPGRVAHVNLCDAHRMQPRGLDGRVAHRGAGHTPIRLSNLEVLDLHRFPFTLASFTASPSKTQRHVIRPSPEISTMPLSP